VAALVALDQAANPGQQWVYYGIVAGGIPVNVPGCNGWGATGGLAGAPQTYAHEIGHQFGLPHARCGNAGNGNPNYPVYEPYDLPVDPPNTTNWTMASIGEYGLNINSGAIANPGNAEDFMSYCGPAWISVFTYNFLTNIAGLTPQVIPTGAAAPRLIKDESPPLDRDASLIEPMIHLLGVIGIDGAVDVTSVARIDTRYLRGDGRQTGYIAQHLDAEGRVLTQDVLYGYHSDGAKAPPRPSKHGHDGGDRDGDHDCRCGSPDCHGDCAEPQPVLFKAMLRDTAPGAALRIVKRGKVVWERHGAAAQPKLSSALARVGKSGELELSWKLDSATSEATEVWARWSADDGKTWHALTVGLRGKSATLPAAQLPSGTVRIELLAHDGFHTARATTDAVTLPPRPPSLAILYPVADGKVYGDRLIHLWGSAASHAGRTLDAGAAEWFIDGKPAGRGLDLWVANPGAGRHELKLVIDDAGQEGSATLSFEVLDNDAPSAAA
jgi:hypothetical protein